MTAFKEMEIMMMITITINETIEVSLEIRVNSIKNKVFFSFKNKIEIERTKRTNKFQN